ncbi:MAG: hypothetical protein JJ992_15945, partial [Planctomycetes bacterium]|nr:hypothetical protein [Planctomycetota bacterium]
ELHSTAGATVVGVRAPLIAYNVNLATTDLKVAERIAKAIRFRDGGFRFAKALGFEVKEKGCVQVSINMTDYTKTPLYRVFETVKREAARWGVNVIESEIVGLVPQGALNASARYFLQLNGFKRNQILENRLVPAKGLPDFLNEEGANCLLKTLEEPPPGTLILLIGSSEQRQLPTIRSRCQTIRVGPLPMPSAIRLLREVHGMDADETKLRDAIEISGGDMHAAVRLLRGEANTLRESLIARLRGPHPDPIAIGKLFNQHLSDVGKEPMKRRAAMRDLFSISVQHFRHQLRRDALENRFDPSTLARLDRSVRALREVDRSANQATLIECFAADIAGGTTGDRGEIG